MYKNLQESISKILVESKVDGVKRFKETLADNTTYWEVNQEEDGSVKGSRVQLKWKKFRLLNKMDGKKIDSVNSILQNL